MHREEFSHDIAEIPADPVDVRVTVFLRFMESVQPVSDNSRLFAVIHGRFPAARF